MSGPALVVLHTCEPVYTRAIHAYAQTDHCVYHTYTHTDLDRLRVARVARAGLLVARLLHVALCFGFGFTRASRVIG